MLRSKRLKVVLDLSQRQEDECGKLLKNCRLNLHQQQAKLDELASYQTEYAERKAQIGDGVTGANALQNLIKFLSSLDQAIIQQQVLVNTSREQLQQLKHAWQRKHAKKEKLFELIERYQFEEDVDVEKRLQKELDDRSALSSKPY